MKITLNTSEVASLLLEDQFADWSISGAEALAEYIEQYDEANNTDTEIDCVALREQYSEYESLQEWAKGHFIDPLEYDFFDTDEGFRDYIRDTCCELIEFEGGIIVSTN